ncbi:hypothetical protein [Pantoea ananatis]|uniref:hypothetical protein n=1 Tax=Pantoea ananas TaxID=553 RepID=UPI0023AF00ED|nr:hypothetical protein [Pantoea ananatis]
MSVLITHSNDFVYAFELIRNAAECPLPENCRMPSSGGLGLIRRHYDTFRAELIHEDALPVLASGLDTYAHCVQVLQDYFTGNPSGLSGHDARIYGRYLETGHEEFVELARELDTGRR